MRKIFAKMLEEHAPKMNRGMVDGMAMTRIGLVESYVDSIFKFASKSFPPGLEYVGYERCTPFDEYMESTKPHNNRRTYDIARSDLYMCKFHLRYNGVNLRPKYISLPFLRDGGILWLGGSSYQISPVLSDQVISIGFDSIFIRLLRDKLTFKRVYHILKCDGESEAVQVVWSRIYRSSGSSSAAYAANRAGSKIAVTTRAGSTVLHYLLCRFGFKETMRRLLNTQLVVGEEEINEDNYPQQDWVICSSIGMSPKTFIGAVYTPSNIRVAIPRKDWSMHAKTVIASFFYLVDHFPKEITIQSLENRDWWMILLGNIVLSGNFTSQKLFSKISEHFDSIEDYVDGIISRKLADVGYRVDNLYDLLILILTNFNKWILENQNQLTSIYNKNLEIDYYVMFDISSGIFKFMFNLNKIAARKNLTIKDVEELLKNIKPGAIYHLTSGNLAVSNVSYSGDNKYPKITATLAEQESRPGPRRGEHKRKVPDITKRFHSSMLELGSFLYLPKSNPVAISRLNPYTTVQATDGVIRPRLYPEILKGTQDLIDSSSMTIPAEVSEKLPR